jgi:hypothetical protein
MASKGQSGLKSEEADSCQVRSTALGAFERTHGRTQEPRSHTGLASPNGYLRSNARICGRMHAQLALAVIAVICGRTCTLRSTTNNWCV